jgi:hypothetical protein
VVQEPPLYLATSLQLIPEFVISVQTVEALIELGYGTETRFQPE